MATHGLPTCLFSFPRGNFLSPAPQKQSGEKAISTVQPDVKADGCSPPAALRAVGDLFCHHASRISGRDRDGLKFLASHLKSHGLSQEAQPYRWDEAMICILADLRLHKGEKKKKDVQTVWVFGYLMWLAWLCELLRKEMLPAEVAMRHCNHTLVIWVLPIKVWLELGFMTQLIWSLCWEEVGQAEKFGERGCPVRSGSRAAAWFEIKPWSLAARPTPLTYLSASLAVGSQSLHGCPQRAEPPSPSAGGRICQFLHEQHRDTTILNIYTGKLKNTRYHKTHVLWFHHYTPGWYTHRIV